MPDFQYDVFLSHNHADKPRVRRLAERLATRLNELAVEGENRASESEGRPPETGHDLVMAHHGSLSRERRLIIEDDLKRWTVLIDAIGRDRLVTGGQ